MANVGNWPTWVYDAGHLVLYAHDEAFSMPRHGRHTPFPRHLGPPPSFNMTGPRSEGYRPREMPQTPVPSRTNRREIPQPFRTAGSHA